MGLKSRVCLLFSFMIRFIEILKFNKWSADSAWFQITVLVRFSSVWFWVHGHGFINCLASEPVVSFS